MSDPEDPVIRSYAFPFVAAAVTMMSGCNRPGDGSGVRIDVRDSAGIEIVDHRLAGAAPAIAFRMADSATVSIGQAEGDDPYLFSRVSAATRLADGRIVVADARSGELRFFDAAGRHLQTVGRIGDGPGEFRLMFGMLRLPGDTLLVGDRRHARLTAVTPQGEIARVMTLRPLYDAARIRSMEFHGQLNDGRLLATSPPAESEAAPTDGLQVNRYVYRAVDPVLPAADSIATLYQEQTVLESRGNASYLVVSVQYIPLMAAASQTAAADGFYYTDGRTFTISRYSVSDGLRRLIRLDRTPAPVTDAVVDETIVRATSHMTPERRAQAERRIRDMPLPDTLPAFAELKTDGAGRLWAREWRLGSDTPATWLVFSDEGRLIGSVEIAAGCTVLEIGVDYVLCSTRDQLEVERVALRTLVPANE